MDINAAIELIRSFNEEYLPAWKLCRAAGIEMKHLLRLRGKPEVAGALKARGLIYAPSQIKVKRKDGSIRPGPGLAAFATPEWLRSRGYAEHYVDGLIEKDAEAVEDAQTSARASRREYKARQKGGLDAARIATLPPPPPKPLRGTTSPALLKALANCGASPMFPPKSEDQYQKELREWETKMADWRASLPPDIPEALCTQQAIWKVQATVKTREWNGKWDAEAPQRAAKREREATDKTLSDLDYKHKVHTRRMDMDRKAARLAYDARLIDRVMLPDPKQLDLFEGG